jgi:hypothetical protein
MFKYLAAHTIACSMLISETCEISMILAARITILLLLLMRPRCAKVCSEALQRAGHRLPLLAFARHVRVCIDYHASYKSLALSIIISQSKQDERTYLCKHKYVYIYICVHILTMLELVYTIRCRSQWCGCKYSKSRFMPFSLQLR